MKLDSARGLKYDLLERAGRELTERRSYHIRGLGRPLEVEEARPVAAIGVAPRQRPEDYAVAIRVFAGQERYAGGLLDRLPTDEADVVAGCDYRPRYTLSAGGSCGHYAITAGTLGGFVEDAEGYYILSNNHVLANSDGAAFGDPILQPGPDDIRRRYRIIGRLNRWMPLTASVVDAAAAHISPDIEWFRPWHYTGIGEMKKVPVRDRYLTRTVVKRGRTTKLTKGRVTAFELDGIRINYGTARKPRWVEFDDQLEFVGHPDPRVPFSQPGDSGSFILDTKSRKAYGLLYGGGPDGQGIDRTLGHFMPEVLNSLGVWLVQ